MFPFVSSALVSSRLNSLEAEYCCCTFHQFVGSKQEEGKIIYRDWRLSIWLRVFSVTNSKKLSLNTKVTQISP